MAVLTKPSVQYWQVETLTFPSKSPLRSGFFVDGNNGWVGGKGTLYGTRDGGKSWIASSLIIDQKSVVTQLQFSTQSNGWAVIQQKSDDVFNITDNNFRLVRTTDAGLSWHTQLESSSSVSNRIRFMNELEGWLVGFKLVGTNPIKWNDLLLHTVDGGLHWLDMSNQLRGLVDGPYGSTNEQLTDIAQGGESTLRLLISDGRVLESKDSGMNWREVNGRIDTRNYVCSCQLGKISGDYTIVGSKDDTKSVIGMLAVRVTNTWQKIMLSGISFDDAVFLNGDRILTCGSTTPNQEGNTDKRAAVITYSPDGGKTWSFVYQNTTIPKMSALAAVDSDHLWAVGDNGLVLWLTTTTK